MGNKLCSCETDFPQKETTDANLTVNYNRIHFELPKSQNRNRKEMMIIESLTETDNSNVNNRITIPSTNRKDYERFRKFIRKCLIKYYVIQLSKRIKENKTESKVKSIYDKMNQLNVEAKSNKQITNIQKIVNDNKKNSTDTLTRREIEELKKGLIINNKSKPLSSAIDNAYKKKETKYSIISNITTSQEEEKTKPKAPPIKKSYIFKNKNKIINTSKRNTAIFDDSTFGNKNKTPSFACMNSVPPKEDKKTTIEETSEGNNLNSVNKSSSHHSDNISYNEYD